MLRTETPVTTAATGLIPLDVDAGWDAASMVVALHARAERQFARYDDAEGSHPRQQQAVRALGAALATHAALERELLYPAVEDGTSHASVDCQMEQDRLLGRLLEGLRLMAPGDRHYDAKVRVLMQLFRQHARDAEALLIPRLRRLGPAEREHLGRRLLERAGRLEVRSL